MTGVVDSSGRALIGRLLHIDYVAKVLEIT